MLDIFLTPVYWISVLVAASAAITHFRFIDKRLVVGKIPFAAFLVLWPVTNSFTAALWWIGLFVYWIREHRDDVLMDWSK